MSPQDQASWLSKQAEDVKTQRYWERNATVTFIVLTVCALASTLVAPISWVAAGAAVAGGALFYVGVRRDRQGRSGQATLMTLGAMGILATLALYSGLSKSLFVVQILGLFIVGFTGAEVFRQATVERSE